MGDRCLWKRLDRMLVNEYWLTSWPDSKYIASTPGTSDHSPLILTSNTTRIKSKGMFRFDNFLASQENFIQEVTRIWRNSVHGTHMYSVTVKLKALKHVFRGMRKAKGDLTYNVLRAKQYLDQAQTLLHKYPHSDSIQLLEHLSRIMYSKAVNLERLSLQQRANMTWLKDGDSSSKVFFRKIAAKRVRQRIYQLEDSFGRTIQGEEAITQEVVAYFKNLLGRETSTRDLDLSYLHCYFAGTLTNVQAVEMIKPVMGDEVCHAVFDIEDQKASGLDGYTATFFKKAWEVVGEEITIAVQQFFSS
ncbi:UNVERIFIED_CONTAM: hypothetical protein Sangu_2978600, partial [Sesamum angustifolium]